MASLKEIKNRINSIQSTHRRKTRLWTAGEKQYKAQQKAARTHTRDNTCRRVMVMLSKDSEMPYIYI